MESEQLKQQTTLIARLQEPGRFDHPTPDFELIETHISWVILTGDYAYKLKKAVDFGFLDYSTLAKRKAQCEEELRLNRRTAAELYLEVVAVGGTPEQPRIGQQPAIEYMVKMRRFPQQALLSQQLKNGNVSKEMITLLASSIADFHATIDIADEKLPYGTPESVWFPVDENFEQIRERISDSTLLQRLADIEQESRNRFERIRPLLEQRKAGGAIRDCHGDLHLNNIVLLNAKPLLFDCIEFNPTLRIIDTISEVAFLVMDLEEHGRTELANLFLNHYLQCGGDYKSVSLLRFYLCYRAMVRAKVATLRLDQPGLLAEEEQQVHNNFANYLQLAERYSEPQRPRLIITHGLSGSGKTTITTELMQRIGAVRIRSDIERKRLFGLAADSDSGSSLGSNIYTAAASRQTYEWLAELAEAILDGGYSVIIDATFLRAGERENFRQLARHHSTPFTILSFELNAETLRQRVANRVLEGSDASEAGVRVLEAQLASFTPLSTDDLIDTIICTTGTDSDEIVGLLNRQQKAPH